MTRWIPEYAADGTVARLWFNFGHDRTCEICERPYVDSSRWENSDHICDRDLCAELYSRTPRQCCVCEKMTKRFISTCCGDVICDDCDRVIYRRKVRQKGLKNP